MFVFSFFLLSEEYMIQRIFDSYDDNNYYIDVNRKKLAYDNLATVGSMLTFFLFVSAFFVAVAIAFGDGFAKYVVYIPAIGALLVLRMIHMRISKRKAYEFEVTRIISLLFYAVVILAFSIADIVIYSESRAVFFPIAILMFSVLYMDYFGVRFLFKFFIAIVFFLADAQVKSRLLIINDFTIAVLASLAAIFSYSMIIRMTLSRHEDNEQLVQKSQTDLLTGLLNKVSFEEKCDEYLARKMIGGKCTMFIFDLDDFKHINDNYGHQTGDKVLKLFSEILQGYFHPDDLIGRIGGDEFMVLVLGEMPDSFVERRCRSVLHELKTTNIDGASGITCSIGIAESTQKMTFKEMYDLSDKALYMAKEGGKARFFVNSHE